MLDDTQAQGPFAVDLTARAVPVGFWEGTAKLSLVLGLRPLDAGGADLATLPSALFGALTPADLSVEVKAVALDPDGKIPVPKDKDPVLRGVEDRLLTDWTPPPDAETARRIDGLWAHVMPKKAGESFAQLYEGLQQYVAAISRPPKDDPLMPTSALPDFAGQIAVACQIERALVERMAITDAKDWQKRVTDAAARAALAFFDKHGEDLEEQGALPKLDGDKTPKSSMQISIDREKAAAKITGPQTAAVSAASQALGAAMCGGGSTDECRDMLRAGTPDPSRVAGMMEMTFQDILGELFYLNQANIRATAMGAAEAQKIKASAEMETDTEEKTKKKAAGIQPEDMPPPPGMDHDGLKLFQSRFKELETNGEFARMFGLVHDFGLTADALAAIDAMPVICDPLGKPSRYMMIRFRARTDRARALLRDECSNYTLAKLSGKGGGRDACFTPVTQQEIVVVLGAGGTCDARDCEVIPELDGVRLLSAHRDAKVPAYELTSINPRDAMQDLDTRLSSILTLVAEAKKDAGEGDVSAEEIAKKYRKSRPPAEPWPLAALKSRSLRLYHTHQHSSLDYALGRTRELHGKDCEAFSLDSDDLAVGWTYDASARCFGDDSNSQWHALSGARIAYSDGRRGSGLDIDRIIAARFKHKERPRYQRASWAVAQQVKTASTPDPEKTDQYAVADELVYEYSGEQQGADNAVGSRDASGGAYVKTVPRDGLLDIGRRYGSLSGLEVIERPVELLNGLGYYLGARSVYVGGNIMPDEAAHRVMEEVECAPVPRLMPGKTRPGHRLLRSEKIARPLVLLNGEAPGNKAGPYSRRYLPNTTRDVTLRSKLKGDTYRREGRFDEERLVVVPGTVDLELAHRHDAFQEDDTITIGGARLPRDGLRGARMDNDPAGWATLDDVFSGTGANAVLTRRDINAAIKPQAQTGGRAPTNAVFLPARGRRRDQPYYPDPLHGWTAFRLRRPGTRDRWLGRTVCIEQPGDTYPDVVPVSVTIRRADALRIAQGAGRVTVAGIACADLQIDLPPGLSAELVVWPVPDLARFALSSEVVTLQTMIARAAKAGLACIDGIEDDDLQPDPILNCLRKADLASPEPGTETCGIACAPAPGAAELKRVAEELHAIMMQRPLDVACGHSVVNLTHAVDLPRYVPVPVPPARMSLEPDPMANPDIFARRSDSISERPSDKPGLVPEVGHIPAAFFGEGEPGLSVKGRGSDVDLAGFLEFDPLTTGAVEIDVIAGNPLRGPIDDVLRTRGAKNILDSEYPTREGETDFLDVEETYGMRVYPDETAAAKRQKVRLARIADIPAFAEDLADRDLSARPWTPPKAYLALHRLFSLTSNTAEDDPAGGTAPRPASGTPVVRSRDGIAIDVDPVLNFTQSRRLGLRFRAIGRHAKAMTPRRTTADAPAIADVAREWTDRNRTVDLPLPSSRRPDPPVAAVKAEITRAPDIRQTLSDTSFSLCRVNEIRLSFARPFLSSGPEERIGIVLSPRPGSFAKDGRYAREFSGLHPTADRYRLKERFPSPRDLPADLAENLTQFADKGTRPPLARHPDTRETGPYGLYPVPLPILADGIFDRYGKWCGSERDDVGYVPDAQLPIYEAGYDPETQATRPDIYYPVDLLTYVPRFDPAKERWYVNIRLDPRHTLDPHLQLGVVRYQPLAPRDLRVSPVGNPFRCPVQPRRVTTITRERAGDDILLAVTTEGPAATGVSDGLDMGPKSHFSARLTGLERHGPTITHRHLDDTREMNALTAQDPRTARFVLTRDEVQQLDLRLTVREIEARTASTQSIEPVMDTTGQEEERSGPLYRVNENLSAFLRGAYEMPLDQK